ncbi:DUF2637 domain-containing protein [Dactylosporangium sp. AC04546]|uniref:DUF2637 domain-containing protein n=1 Tax=Dactylosporangium sp. AC04546 TaxID=2862460 RepID=UPI0027E03F09|nr:DUF2637 domain-containing protein [Dactylosporangium sp. AC04546]WVK83581.1 DUF2637 domain-containing protein [Dactylosporangium sp. AC04546]
MTTATTTTPRRPVRSDTKRRKLPFTTEQLESFVLVFIVLVVGVAAGAASFTHVHDWTLKHTPPGTPDWFGWANACISDLLPVGAFLEMKRRRRANRTYRLPQILMFAGMALSLAAQLAVAEPSISGWLLSAVRPSRSWGW